MLRAHLHKWVAAAIVVQRSLRAWLFRRRLQEWLHQHRAAAVLLQSAWRGSKARLQLQQERRACTVIQVMQEWMPPSTAVSDDHHPEAAEFCLLSNAAFLSESLAAGAGKAAAVPAGCCSW